MRATSRSPFETIGELLHDLGGIDPNRIRLKPSPGRATERDVMRLHERTKRLFELVDGTLVEKVMGFGESFVAGAILEFLRTFVRQNKLGSVGDSQCTVRLLPGLVRIPDVVFFRRDQLPGGKTPLKPAIPSLVPALAVEVLSESNTPGEMERKLKEYFLAGVQLVWFVDPVTRTVSIYTPKDSTTLGQDQVLDGGAVLPGFAVPIRELFADLPDENIGASPKNQSSRNRPSRKSQN